MIAIFKKKTTQIDLYRPLRNYIAFHYFESEAQNHENDLQVLKQPGSDLECQPDSSLLTCPDLLQHFKAFCLVETRFPISPDKDHINIVTFVWHDAFKNKKKASYQSIHLEKAVVLINLGAMYSQIGLSYDPATVAFAFLRDNTATKASTGSSKTVDFSVECAGMLERLMLTQAQAQAQGSVFGNTISWFLFELGFWRENG